MSLESKDQLVDSLITIRRYLRQHGLDRFGKLIDKVTEDNNPFKATIDWNDVYFEHRNLDPSSALQFAAQNLTLKPQDRCSLQVVIAYNLPQAQAGVKELLHNKSALIIAFCDSFKATKEIKDYVSTLPKDNFPQLRFDFVNPDAVRGRTLHQTNLEEELLERVKEGCLALQMDFEQDPRPIESREFQAALEVAATSVELKELYD